MWACLLALISYRDDEVQLQYQGICQEVRSIMKIQVTAVYASLIVQRNMSANFFCTETAQHATLEINQVKFCKFASL